MTTFRLYGDMGEETRKIIDILDKAQINYNFTNTSRKGEAVVPYLQHASGYRLIGLSNIESVLTPK